MVVPFGEMNRNWEGPKKDFWAWQGCFLTWVALADWTLHFCFMYFAACLLCFTVKRVRKWGRGSALQVLFDFPEPGSKSCFIPTSDPRDLYRDFCSWHLILHLISIKWVKKRTAPNLTPIIWHLEDLYQASHAIYLNCEYCTVFFKPSCYLLCNGCSVNSEKYASFMEVQNE